MASLGILTAPFWWSVQQKWKAHGGKYIIVYKLTNVVLFSQFSSVSWPIGSSTGHEGRFSRDSLPIFSAGGPCEQFWQWPGCRLFHVILLLHGQTWEFHLWRRYFSIVLSLLQVGAIKLTGTGKTQIQKKKKKELKIESVMICIYMGKSDNFTYDHNTFL